MSFVVVDFEWNQAMRSDSSVFNHLPIHLRGEIIEIGATKLNDDMTLGQEFRVFVRPVFFKKMHFQVKKITGIDQEQLEQAVGFPEAMEMFMEFCGPNPTFITWGCDDKEIFEQNVIVHDLEWEWINDWINLQLIYNIQTGGDKNQKSLSDAMEHFSIVQTREFHDALGDAYNTAIICTKLDLKEGLKVYSRANEILSARMPTLNPLPTKMDGPEPIVHDCFEGFDSKAEAFADNRISAIACLKCGQMMTSVKWINQGDGRYMNIYKCSRDGEYLARVKFKKDNTNHLVANRLIYEANDEMKSFYKEKQKQLYKRGRVHRRKNKRSRN